MSPMDSLPRPERRDTRYALHLPVSLKLAHKELHTRSENISLGGILLSSAFLIPEGSTVEVTFGVAHRPNAATHASARGKVLRVQPKATGDFALAIAFEHPFRDGLQGLAPESQQEEGPASPKRKTEQSPAEGCTSNGLGTPRPNRTLLSVGAKAFHTSNFPRDEWLVEGNCRVDHPL
jgi:hypothetical protein